MDRNKLIKFLNLTSSKNDGEALSAIRKAGIMLKDDDLYWSDVIGKDLKLKELKDEYSILNMNLSKERAYSQEIKEKIRGYKNLVKFLFIIIIVLVILLIFK